jgi:hypothetical protein
MIVLFYHKQELKIYLWILICTLWDFVGEWLDHQCWWHQFWQRIWFFKIWSKVCDSWKPTSRFMAGKRVLMWMASFYFLHLSLVSTVMILKIQIPCQNWWRHQHWRLSHSLLMKACSVLMIILRYIFNPPCFWQNNTVNLYETGLMNLFGFPQCCFQGYSNSSKAISDASCICLAPDL